MPRVSAVIICYNGAEHVAGAIESALAQTERDLEVVVVDDGSTDDSAAIAERCAAADARVRVVRQQNQGPSAARNTGARVAASPWVAYLDVDDRWAPEKLAAQLDAAARVRDAALVSSAYYIERGGLSGLVPGAPESGRTEGMLLDDMLLHNFVATSSAMVRVDALFEVGGWDVKRRQAEDWHLWLRLAARYPVVVVDRPLVTKHHVDGSLGSQPQRMAQGAHDVLEDAFATCARHRAPELRRRALANLHYMSALNFNSARDRRAERRELLRVLRYRPLDGHVCRRILRSFFP